MNKFENGMLVQFSEFEDSQTLLRVTRVLHNGTSYDVKSLKTENVFHCQEVELKPYVPSEEVTSRFEGYDEVTDSCYYCFEVITDSNCNTRHCHNCGYYYLVIDNFCTRCGTPNPNSFRDLTNL